MSYEPFIVLNDEEAVKRGGPAAPTKVGDFGWTLYEQGASGKLIRAIGSDGGEPEDQLLVRDWSWVVEALNEERDRYEAQVEDVVSLNEGLERWHAEAVAARKKWGAYEQDFILPLFQIATTRMGFDLQQLVLDQAGKSSSVLFAEHVEAKLAAAEARAVTAEALAVTAEDLGTELVNVAIARAEAAEAECRALTSEVREKTLALRHATDLIESLAKDKRTCACKKHEFCRSCERTVLPWGRTPRPGAFTLLGLVSGATPAGKNAVSDAGRCSCNYAPCVHDVAGEDMAALSAKLASAEARAEAAVDCGSVCGTVGQQCQACLRKMFYREVEARDAAEARAMIAEANYTAACADRDAWEKRARGHAEKASAAEAIACELRGARPASIQQGFDLAYDNAEISEHDGWHRVAPFIEWGIARKALDAALSGVTPAAKLPPHDGGAVGYQLDDPRRYPCRTCGRPAGRVEVTHGKEDGREVSLYRPIYVCVHGQAK